jgi:hypothetical protein
MGSDRGGGGEGERRRGEGGERGEQEEEGGDGEPPQDGAVDPDEHRLGGLGGAPRCHSADGGGRVAGGGDRDRDRRSAGGGDDHSAE